MIKKNSTAKKRVFTAFIISLLLAVATIFVVYKYVTPERITIFVFKDNYKAGTQVTKDMLVPVQIDSNVLSNGLKVDANSIFVSNANIQTVLSQGDSLRSDVLKNAPLTPTMLTITGGSGIEINMKPNSVAVTIGVNSLSGVTNDLKIGSRVNVYSTTATQEEASTNLILEAMKILEVQKNENGYITGVTLEVSKDESIKLIHSLNYGSIYLGLIDIDNYNNKNKAQEITTEAPDMNNVTQEQGATDENSDTNNSSIENNATTNQ